MSAVHSVELTIEREMVIAVAKCSDQSADCHYACAEGCGTWGPILRNEAGAVIGHRTDDPHVTHRMRHVEDCLLIPWLNAFDGVLEGFKGEPIKLTIPAKLTFEDEDTGVTWTGIGVQG